MATVELIDLGAGSGVLAAGVCRELGGFFAGQNTRPTFRVWALDLWPMGPKRFFAQRDVRRFTDSLTIIKADYRDWLSADEPFPPARGLRVALASRFFNNLSDFQIDSLSPAQIPWLRDFAGSDWKNCLPSRCLGRGQPGASALLISNSRAWIGGGRTFKQVSLSQYYRGLYTLMHPQDADEPLDTPADRVFLPRRRFRRSALRNRDGGSIIERLNDWCDLIVVQDADLRPSDLRAHCDRAGLSGLVAIDMTKQLGLRGHYCYALGDSRDDALKSLDGQRLW